MHPKISEFTTIILTKNSEHTIERVIKSVSWSGQILVADDGSTDETLAIAKKLGAGKVKLGQTQSFAAKRNEALNYAPTEWILFVDSDEWVSDELKESLFTFFKTEQHKQFDAMRIRRTDFLFGKKLRYGETAHMYLLRLAKKNAGKWQRHVHEVWEVQGNVGTLEGELYHEPHPTLESFIDKVNTYTELEAYLRVNKFQVSSSQFQRFLFLTSCFQLVSYPPAKFLLNFVVKLGFLDGYRGLIMAWMMSLHSLCVRIKVIEKLSKENYVAKRKNAKA